MGKGIRPTSGQCYRCEGPVVIANRNPEALLCARCLRRTGACHCTRIAG
jgi:hypothetical protein